MKKNLLMLIFVFSLVFAGFMVANAETSGRFEQNTEINQYAGITSVKTNKLIGKYNKTLLVAKKVCLQMGCAFMLEISASAFDSMLSACNYAETSSACANAQSWIEIVTEATLDACSSSNAKMLQQHEVLPTTNHSKLVKKV